MFRYKTYLNLKCKTFKFEKGLNILIPIDIAAAEALVNEMVERFNNAKIMKSDNNLFMYTYSPDDITCQWDSPETTNCYDKFICLIDGRHTNFMFMSASEKLNFRIRLNELSKKYDNLYIIFVTDDYGHLSHNRCMAIDNSRTARTFKSYDAYSKFLLRSTEDELPKVP